jgi:hypothetical protein
MDRITQEKILIVYVPRNHGGRGLLQVERAYAIEIKK